MLSEWFSALLSTRLSSDDTSSTNNALVASLVEKDVQKRFWVHGAAQLSARELDILGLTTKDQVELCIKFVAGGYCDLNEPDALKRTALHYAAENGNQILVDFLIGAGSDVNASTSGYQVSVLHQASYGGHANIVRTLCHHRADVNALAGKFQETTPALAAAQNGHRNVVEELVRFGARADVPFPTITEDTRHLQPAYEWRPGSSVWDVLTFREAQDFARLREIDETLCKWSELSHAHWPAAIRNNIRAVLCVAGRLMCDAASLAPLPRSIWRRILEHFAELSLRDALQYRQGITGPSKAILMPTPSRTNLLEL